MPTHSPPRLSIKTGIAKSHGVLWFCGIRRITRYDPRIDGQEAFKIYSDKDGVNNHVYAATQDSRGDIWFSTLASGYLRFDGNAFEQFDSRNSPLVQWTYTPFEDAEGILWFTHRRGVVRYDPSITVFTEKDGLSFDFVWPVLEDSRGDLWIGNWNRVSGPGGVMRYDGREIVHFGKEDGIAAPWIWSIIEDRSGKLWFGGFSGLYRYDGETIETVAAHRGGPNTQSYVTLMEDREGRIWAGTTHGIRLYENGERKILTGSDKPEAPIGKLRVSVILEDLDGNIWAGTWDGVLRWDGESFTHYNVDDGLVNRAVWSGARDREGNLWFGTEGGISKHNPRNGAWENFTVAHGLPENRIEAIAEDQDGNMWFGSKGGGVIRYDGRTFQTISLRDGLPHNSVNGITQDRDGNYWFTTEKGLVRYRPPPPNEPGISIDAVVADRRYERSSDVEVPSTVELITFEYHGTSLKTQPGGMVYRYRLLGHDDTWRQTREEQMGYEGLPRGSYTFEVVAVDRDMGYSASPATVHLAVHWPYERTGWMASLGIAIVLIGWQTVRVVRRDRRLTQANRALSDANNELFEANVEIKEQTERKSAFLASMSHELRTPMNAIKGFTNLVLRREKSLSDRGEENLKKVGQASNHLLAMINDLLDLSKIEAGRMAVNPERFDVKELVATCCDTVSPLMQEGVELKEDVNDDIGEANTDKARLQQMVINLLSNAIKFTDSGEVKVVAGLSTRDSGPATDLVISVSDTGKGIPADALPTLFDEYRQVKGESESSVQKGTGLGLSITKKFAELLGGEIEVSSEVGSGSTFTVRIPVRYEEETG